MASDNSVLEATESFHTTLDGQLVTVIQGMTRIRADHQLNKLFPQHFRPIEEGLSYGLEEATNTPGEVRNREVVHTAPEELRPPAEPPEPSGPKPTPARASAKTTK